MGQITATPNQSFLCKAMELRIAAALAVLLQDLGFNVANHPTAYLESPTDAFFYPTKWREAKQFFSSRPSGMRKASTVGVSFKNARWDGEKSDINRGVQTLDHKVIESDAAKTKIIKNGTDVELHVSYEEAEELTNSFSSSVTKGVTLDMTRTQDESVDASTTVKGEYAGVSAEASLAAHFGISKSRSESKSSELGREKAEEGTTSESIAIEFDAEPRSNYLISITKENEQTRRPFEIDGVMDFDIAIQPQNRYWQNTENSGHRPNGDIRLTGIAGLLQFVFGYDTNYPMMQGYWAKAPAQVDAAMNWIQDGENRRIQASGVSQANLDSNESFEVQPLGSSIPSEFADLPQVDAQDVSR